MLDLPGGLIKPIRDVRITPILARAYKIFYAKCHLADWEMPKEDGAGFRLVPIPGLALGISIKENQNLMLFWSVTVQTTIDDLSNYWIKMGLNINGSSEANSQRIFSEDYSGAITGSGNVAHTTLFGSYMIAVTRGEYSISVEAQGADRGDNFPELFQEGVLGSIIGILTI